MSYSDEQIIARYLALRDQRQEVEARHALELVPFKKGMLLLENIMGDRIAQSGENKIATEAGTSYQHKTISMRLDNRKKFITFCLGQPIPYNLMDVEPSKNGVKTYRAQQQRLKEDPAIPGLLVDPVVRIMFRKNGKE
jgi:hypothetical protein